MVSLYVSGLLGNVASVFKEVMWLALRSNAKVSTIMIPQMFKCKYFVQQRFRKSIAHSMTMQTRLTPLHLRFCSNSWIM